MKIGATIILTLIIIPWLAWGSLVIYSHAEKIARVEVGVGAAINTNKVVCLMAIDLGMKAQKVEKFCVGDK